MKKKHKNKSFWKRIRFKYKLSFYNESTLEQVWSFRLSQLTGIVVILIFAFLLVILTSLFIIMTPVRNYLPGYTDVEVRKEILTNVLKADSLEDIINAQSRYIKNISDVLSGNISPDSIPIIDSITANSNYDIPRGAADSAFIQRFEEEERYNLTELNPNPPQTVKFFYRPVNGVISSAFDVVNNHYGIDLTAAGNANVFSVLDGTVIYTGFDPNYGNVIVIQHNDGFVSFYKHNNMLLKETGEKVREGEAVAVVGNTGKLSTGAHLHFELWHNGSPVNPEEYIVF
ncbi:MAG: M23 family metallopeptidase [Tannerella sp.]|jgi:lipoprotein NlpD|nr:M23 family metallopeptidase [Tannerella sp.]